MKSPIILLAVLITSSTYAQRLNPCVSQTTCHDCIQEPNCAWCTNPNYNDSRCFEASLATVDKCREEYILNPINVVSILESKVRTESHVGKNQSPSSTSSGYQVSPQRINMKLRKNEAVRIKMSYTHAQILPVDQISTKVVFKDNSTDGVRIIYYSNCLDLSDQPNPTNICPGMKLGDEIQFEVEIEVLTCLKNSKDWKQTFQIYPVGIQESLTVDLEMICSCPCESPDHFSYKPNAEECSGSGTSKCGICECNSNNFGKHCECSVNEQTWYCKTDEYSKY